VVQRGAGTSSRAHARHIAGLDGLRGLAVAAVVAYHLGWIPGGFLGVDVFFVLSGFLVTSLILAEVTGTGRLDLRAFWGRRIRRLLPAVLVLVPAVLVGALAVGWTPSRLGALVTDGVATLTWWANWRQAGGTSYWAAGPSPLRHAWSLSIEEQFYIVWPLVVVVATMAARRFAWSPRRVLGTVSLVAAAAGAVWMTVLARSTPASGLSRAYVGTDTRFMAPMAGCALACALYGRGPAAPWVRRVAVVLGNLALVALGLLLVGAHVPDPVMYRDGGFAFAALAAVALVWAVVTADHAGAGGWRSGALAPVTTRPMRHLGQRSYAIYLWSWPAQALVQVWRPTWTRLHVTVVVLVFTAAAAELSHWLVEDPFRRQRWWASRALVRRPAWALAVAMPIVALSVVQHQAAPVPEFERIDTAQSVRQASQAPPPAAPSTTSASSGTASTAPQGLRVMVEGDSTAFTAVWNAPHGKDLPPGIASIDGRGVIGCGLLASAGWDYPRRDESGFEAPAGGACKGQTKAEAIGLTGHPDVVVVMAGAWEYQSVRTSAGRVIPAQSDEMRDVLVDALVKRARTAKQAGAAIAMTAWSCPGSKASPERRDPSYIRWVNAVYDRAAAAARHQGMDAEVLRPSATICQAGAPTGAPTSDWRTATEDEVHVRTPAGGDLLWNAWLGPALTHDLPR
jgi:peptidoglycan/LPS O-acetylase OafA/YrhL